MITDQQLLGVIVLFVIVAIPLGLAAWVVQRVADRRREERYREEEYQRWLRERGR